MGIIMSTQLTFTCSKHSRNTKKRRGICLKLTIKIPERRHWRRYGAFIVDLEHISQLSLVFLLLDLNKSMLAGYFYFLLFEAPTLNLMNFPKKNTFHLSFYANSISMFSILQAFCKNVSPSFLPPSFYLYPEFYQFFKNNQARVKSFKCFWKFC